jgi:hypothetical protein
MATQRYQFRLWTLLAVTTVLCVVLGVVTRWPIVAAIGTLLVGPRVFCLGFGKLVRENAFRGMLAGAALIAVGLALTFILPVVVWLLVNPGSTAQ